MAHYTTSMISGPALGAVSVAYSKELQTALTALAAKTGKTVFDPGGIDGIVGSKTVAAVAAVLPLLVGKMSSKVSTALQLALAVAPVSSTLMAAAKKLVEEQAHNIAAAIKALTILSSTPSEPAPDASITPYDPGAVVVAPPWYKTPLGIAALVGGGLLFLGLGYKILK